MEALERVSGARKPALFPGVLEPEVLVQRSLIEGLDPPRALKLLHRSCFLQLETNLHDNNGTLQLVPPGGSSGAAGSSSVVHRQEFGRRTHAVLQVVDLALRTDSRAQFAGSGRQRAW